MLAQRYRLPAGIIIKKRGGKYLFLDPAKPDWRITNVNGAAALKLCNGKRTVNDIIRILSKAASRDVTDEIKHFFEELTSPSSFFSDSVADPTAFKPYNLRGVQLNLTSRCNLQCIYCYADERTPTEQCLRFEDYATIIDAIHTITKQATVVLTGGEPLLADYALAVAEYAKKKGDQLHLLSNGLLINKNNAPKMAEIFDLIKISIDGSSPAIHDFHRGKGSFEKAARAVEALVDNKANVQVAMTVTQKNIDDVAGMVKNYGAMVTFAPLFKAGRGRALKQLSISGTEYYAALSSVTGVNPLSNLCTSLVSAQKHKHMKCAIGDAEISISDSGDVYPCHLLHLPQFLAGNVREQPLEHIYRTSDKLAWCRNLTVLQTKGCRKCAIRFICGGACRARAFYEKGRLDVCDDFCEYEKRAFMNGLFELHEFDS